MAKRISLSIECEVDESATEEQVASELEAALKPLAPKASKFGQLCIRMIDREEARTASLDRPSAYESKAWGRDTC